MLLRQMGGRMQAEKEGMSRLASGRDGDYKQIIPMNPADLIFVTSKCNVTALRKSDGEEVWATPLATSFFKPSDAFITLTVDASGVYAFALKTLYRLDLLTGQILWKKELPSGWMGREIASIALLGATAGATPAQAAKIRANRTPDGDGGGG